MLFWTLDCQDMCHQKNVWLLVIARTSSKSTLGLRREDKKMKRRRSPQKGLRRRLGLREGQQKENTRLEKKREGREEEKTRFEQKKRRTAREED